MTGSDSKMPDSPGPDLEMPDSPQPVDLSAAVGACAAERGVLAVSGPDAEDFLQGQISQDIAALGQGQSAWSLILQPQGRIDALVRVTRQAADRFVLDTDGPLDQVVARLQRFMLRTDVALEPLDWRCISVRGPGAESPDFASEPDFASKIAAEGEIIAPVPTGGIDILGPAPAVSPDVPAVSADRLEVHRIRSGFPRMGVDITERTIPAEAGVVDFTVSFTKGCFTGQELVARMDSRQSDAPRYLRLLTAEGQVSLPPAEPICVVDGAGSEVVGAVTSAAYDTVAGVTVALGYIKRAVAMPAIVRVAGTAARAEAVAPLGPLPHSDRYPTRTVTPPGEPAGSF